MNEDAAYFYVFNALEVAGIPLHAHIYLNQGRRANNMTSLMHRLSNLEIEYATPLMSSFNRCGR